MVTKNLVTDYGAVPDGQRITTTVTITAASTSLTVTGSPFVVGDVGKHIAIHSAGSADPNISPIGALMTTIAGYTNANQVTLTDAAVRTVSGVSGIVEFGTDNLPAFDAFHDDLTGTSGVTLQLPADVGTGFYCVSYTGPGSVGPWFGFPDCITEGINGTPTISDLLGCGGIVFGGVGGAISDSTYAYMQTVSAGSTSLVCVTPGDAALFTVGKWALMTGYDPQGFGFPPNSCFLQYVLVTNITGSTITISEPLTYSYKSTWPLWFAPLGGPAALYPTIDGWDCDLTFDNFIVYNNDTVRNNNGKTITWLNTTWEEYGANISTNKTITFDGCTLINHTNWEIDKLNDTVNFLNSTLAGMQFQSTSTNRVNVTNCTVDSINGTGRATYYTGCTLAADGIGFSATSYGVGNTVSFDTCEFEGLAVFAGANEGTLIASGYTMADGIISRLKVDGDGGPPRWAVPGEHFVFGSLHTFANTPVRVIDVYEDEDTVYIQTDQSGGFPPIVSPATDLKATAAPITRTTYINCTGTEEAVSWSNWPSNVPQFTRWDYTYVGNVGSSPQAIKIYGTPVYIEITVASGYSAGIFALNTPFIFVLEKPDNVKVTWAPSIDLTTAGVRTLTPSGVTGSAGSDSSLAMPNDGAIWLLEDQIQPLMSGASGSGSVRLKILTDPGYVQSGSFYSWLGGRNH